MNFILINTSRHRRIWVYLQKDALGKGHLLYYLTLIYTDPMISCFCTCFTVYAHKC